jgi:hypothetical protein
MQAVRDALHVNPRQAHRLATHEDARFAHAHKLLGVLVLGHFAWRLCNWYRIGQLGFRPGDPAVLGWLLAHAALHVSSFQFVVPNRRNAVYNIIWPEMRWHSLLFAYRALLVMLLVWAEQVGWVPMRLDGWLRGAVILGTMLCADAATRAYDGKPTMRNNPYPAYVPAALARAQNMFYSLSQLFATLNMLYRGYDMVFLTLIPIQTAPLLMTLEKKGIINQMGWHLWYTVAVAISYAYGITHMAVGNTVTPVALAIGAARFGLRANKYALWGGVIALHLWRHGGYPDPGYAV